MGRLAAHHEYRRVIGGSFLAPWFAVSLGLVIAASLAVVEPSAALSFPPSKGSPCVPSGCANPKPDLARSGGLVTRAPAASGPGRRHGPAIDWPSAGRIPVQVQRYTTGVRISYGLASENHGHFMAMLLITAQRPLGKWTLKFSLAGARIKVIMGGKWGFASPDSVVIAGSPSPWPRSAPNQARIVVFGTGSPRWPRACFYDSARCTFAALTR